MDNCCRSKMNPSNQLLGNMFWACFTSMILVVLVEGEASDSTHTHIYIYIYTEYQRSNCLDK